MRGLNMSVLQPSIRRAASALVTDVLAALPSMSIVGAKICAQHSGPAVFGGPSVQKLGNFQSAHLVPPHSDGFGHASLRYCASQTRRSHFDSSNCSVAGARDGQDPDRRQTSRIGQASDSSGCANAANGEEQMKITEELLAAGSRNDGAAVLQIVELHGAKFDESNMVCTFAQLARIIRRMGANDAANSQARDALKQHKGLETLISMATMGAERFDLPDLARILNGLAVLGVRDELALDMLLRTVPLGLETASVRDIGALMEGLASLQYSSSVLLLDAIKTKLLELKRAGAANTKEIGEVVDKLKQMGYTRAESEGEGLLEKVAGSERSHSQADYA